MEDIFKSKLENYAEQPPVAVWDKIQAKRTPIYIWRNAFMLRGWKYAVAVVAVMGLIFTWYNQPFSSKNKVVVSNDVEIANSANPTAKEAIEPAPKAQTNNGSLTDAKLEEDKISKNENLPNTNLNPRAKQVTHKGSFAEQGSVPKPNITETVFTPKTWEILSKNLLPYGVRNFTNYTIPFDLSGLANQEISSEIKRIIEPDVATRTGDWYVQMNVAPMLSGRTIEGEIELSKLRNSSESIGLGWNTGIQIGKSFGLHWELASGLQVLQRREKLNHQHKYTTQHETYKEQMVKVYHPVLDPYFIKVVDTTVVHTSGQMNFKGTNTYTYVSIPLIARYNYHFKNVYSVFGSVGVLTDIYKSYKGSIMKSQSEEMNVAEIAKATSFNQRALLSAGLKWKANAHWSLMAEPTIILGLGNLNSPAYSIKQKEFGYLVNTSIRYNF